MKHFLSFFLIITGMIVSTALVLVVCVRQLSSSDLFIQSMHDARIAEQLVPTLVNASITTDLLNHNDVQFLTVGQAQSFVIGLFTADWVNAHMTVFIQQAARLMQPGAQLADSVLLLSLEEPKQRFIADFESIKPFIDDEHVGNVFASMDPRAITDMVPNTINILHFFAHTQRDRVVSSYDPLGLRAFASPLSVEEADALMPMQEKIDMVQLWNARTSMLIPAFILIILCIAASGAVMHISVHRVSVLRWLALYSIVIALPWIAAAITLQLGVRGRVLSALHEAPLAIATLADSFVTQLAARASVTYTVIGLLLIAVGFGCACVAQLLRRKTK